MTPFGKWLAEIGFGSFDTVFASNKIDFDVIGSLSDADLRELGLALGDRKRLLQAVARLDWQHTADTSPPAVAPVTAFEPPDDAGGAERNFRASLDWARRQQAKMWELHTSTSLARFLQSQGKRQDAYELLAPVHGWFTEGFDTKDLQDAKSLLIDLE